MCRTVMFSALVVSGLGLGCSTMHPAASQHPGVIDAKPGAVVRSFPASSTLVSERMVDVMRREEILQDVVMYHDPASKECRSFSRLDRQLLGISPLTPANDVNFEVKAKCKDGSPVIVAVRLKGDHEAEASVLYGFGGDNDLARDLLDKVESALNAPGPDASVARTAGQSAGR